MPLEKCFYKSQILFLNIFPLNVKEEFIVSNPKSKLISRSLILKIIPAWMRPFCSIRWKLFVESDYIR